MYLDKFLEKSSIAKNTETLFELFEDILEVFGFDRIACTIMSNHGELRETHELGIIHIKNMEDWAKYYSEKNYIEHDAMQSAGIGHPGIFIWDDMAQDNWLNKKQIEIFQKAKEFGLHDGQTVFVHGHDGVKMAILMARSQSEERPDNDVLNIIQLASNQLLSCYLKLKKHQFKFTGNQLSPKEKQVMKWIAKGLNKADVSEKLSISPHTVDYHIRNVLKKLGAKNTVEATAISIENKYIEL